MTDLAHHYKEVSPEETVQNVVEFFNKPYFRLHLFDVEQSEAGTWYCHIDLYHHDTLLIGANGKGMTKEYAIASGHAELYERFCNMMNFLPSSYFSKTLMQENKKENGYYFRKDEKILTYDELIHSCTRIEEYLTTFTDNVPAAEKAVIEYITEGTYVGIPMHNIDGTDTVYIDPRLLIRTTRSTGMAAGNTINEALVQGISECIERSGQMLFFKNFNTEPHYALNLDKIENPNLQTIIQNIKNEGYDFYLIDLSYNYNIPVMMSLLVDRENGYLNPNFGSFPVFDIAAERVLTELYQGIKSFKKEWHLGQFSLPYKSYTFGDFFNINGNSVNGKLFSAEFFKLLQYKDEYNKKLYADKNLSNEELLQYYIELAKKNNIKYYFIDNSLTDKIHAVQILAEGDSSKIFTGNEGHKVEWTNNNEITMGINILKKFSTFYNEVFNNKKVNMINLIQLIMDHNNNINLPLSNFLGYVILWHNIFIQAIPELSIQNFISFIDCEQIPFEVDKNIINSFIFKEYKKYFQLRLYKNTGLYNNEELLYIFNTVYNYNITEEDIEKCQIGAYMLQKAYIEPLQNYIHSEDYIDFIHMFTEGILHQA